MNIEETEGSGLFPGLPEEDPLPDGRVRELPVAVLAYIGDAVFELYVRLHMVRNETGPARNLHRRTIGLVRASGQARSARHLMEMLTEEERSVFRRGRNHPAPHVPRSADPVDYRNATGLEALIGHLYLRGQAKRLETLMERILASAREESPT